MRKFLAVTTVSAFALALAACGGTADEPEPPVVADEAADTSADDSAGEPDAAAATEGSAGEVSAEEQAPTPTASASAPATPTPTPTRVAAAATPPAGFTTCGVCHSVNPGENRVGPSLAGVVGRRAGSVSGANYSPAMQGVSLTWTEANLDRYLADPNAVVAGGTMPNPGLDAAQRRAIIDYLKTL